MQTVSDDLLKKPLGGRGPYDEDGDLHNTLDLHNTKEAPFGDNIKDEEESSTCTVHLVKSQHSGLIYRPEGDPIEDSTKMIKLETT